MLHATPSILEEARLPEKLDGLEGGFPPRITDSHCYPEDQSARGLGVPVKVVAQRLGHAKTDITNDIYAHALPSMQKDAAAKLSSLLR